jgi:cardiolipin synthase A/B
MKPFLISILACGFIVGCAGSTRQASPALRGPAATRDGVRTFRLFTTPEDMHRSWLAAIVKAKRSIFMEMFHLTDPAIVNALLGKGSGIEIRLILDAVNLQDPETAKIAATLGAQSNIKIIPSSGPPVGFNQTHTKAMVVDGTDALITSINLTKNAAVQRDYGIETDDPALIAEMTAVFTADIQNSQNAQSGQGDPRFTPAGVGQGQLIWSPVGSEDRLVGLIQEAAKIPNGPKKFLNATVENLGDVAIQNALSSAANTGVHLRLIVPQCVLGKNGPRNYDFFPALKNGVEYRVMPHPSSAEKPYMHGKMMVLGNGSAYLGSVNFSKNSTQGNRELGIIFNDQEVADQLDSLFETDWIAAQPVDDPTKKPDCPTDTNDPSL